LMGGLTERDWIPRAPGLRLKQIFLAKTQDEIGHAHLLYMIAADMGAKTRTEMLEDLFSGRSRFHNVFHYQAVTWADQIAIAYLVDAAAFASQRAVFAECTYGPYKRILRRIVAEEGFHMRHGEEMLMRLAEGTPIQHDMFQAALDRWWWPAVQLFGPDSDPADPLLRWKIKSQRNEDLRDAYIQKYVPLLQGYDFAIPDEGLRYDDEAEKWVTSAIDWEPLKATMRQGGPDSRRRIETAARNWADTAWVRTALDVARTGAA
jgi:ring-1,2-phenylacetyl-CoA epoxidase subunit PaaA